MRGKLVAKATFLGLLLGVQVASGATPEFGRAVQHLKDKDAAHAILELEALADRDVEGANVSYNRGVAYLMRASSREKRGGDLGQAVAAFSEALLLEPGDHEAKLLLEETQLAIARAKGRSTAAPVLEVTPLSSRVLNYVSAQVLYAASAFGSLLLTLGILLRGRRSSPLRTAGSLMSASGLGVFALSAALFWLKTSRETTHLPAVVITEKAPFSDELGRSLKGAEPLSEGAHVEVSAKKGRLAAVETELGERYVPLNSLRFLNRPKSP